VKMLMTGECKVQKLVLYYVTSKLQITDNVCLLVS